MAVADGFFSQDRNRIARRNQSLDVAVREVVANMIMSDTIDFLRQIIEGKNLVTDTDLITDLLKKRFLALSQKAVVAALKDAQNRFLMAYPRS